MKGVVLPKTQTWFVQTGFVTTALDSPPCNVYTTVYGECTNDETAKLFPKTSS